MKKNLFNVFLVCVFCVAAIPDVFAQQIKVTGKVTDSTNEGMPGVNVQVKGTAIAGRREKSIECSVER